jgi:hypothetical protein
VTENAARLSQVAAEINAYQPIKNAATAKYVIQKQAELGVAQSQTATKTQRPERNATTLAVIGQRVIARALIMNASGFTIVATGRGALAILTASMRGQDALQQAATAQSQISHQAKAHH